jgi:hypothetical protein
MSEKRCAAVDRFTADLLHGTELAVAPGVCATTIRTVGVKGYDWFTLALVTG